jgi:divalent metal cation (Fe/Co/Zn/Cd) transporter
MIKPMWRLIGLILSLGVFLAAGIANLVGGEELIWVVGKAIAAFFVSWVILNHLGAMLLAVLERPEDAAQPGEAAPTGERGS